MECSKAATGAKGTGKHIIHPLVFYTLSPYLNMPSGTLLGVFKHIRNRSAERRETPNVVRGSCDPIGSPATGLKVLHEGNDATIE